MTAELIEAGGSLAELLLQENKALAAVDLVAAGALLAAKRQATDRFAAAHARAAAAGIPAAQKRPMEQLALRLRDLLVENRRLLERGMLAQNRVIGCIAKAIPRALATAPRYGASGALAKGRTPAAVALSARA